MVVLLLLLLLPGGQLLVDDVQQGRGGGGGGVCISGGECVSVVVLLLLPDMQLLPGPMQQGRGGGGGGLGLCVKAVGVVLVVNPLYGMTVGSWNGGRSRTSRPIGSGQGGGKRCVWWAGGKAQLLHCVAQGCGRGGGK